MLRRCSWLFILSGLYPITTTNAADHGSTSLRDIFLNAKNQWSNETIVSFPSEEAFANATVRWNTYGAPSYSVAVSPADEVDVVKVVKLAVENSISFLATGGRHGYGTGLGELHKGLAIDLSQLKEVSVDPKAATLTIGPGAHFSDILPPVQRSGLQLQVGGCSCPSVIGLTIGGGVGRYQGVYGLVTDALLSVRLVTSRGDLVNVSSTSQPDLFWGLRGAGANFGIITSATYKLNQPVNGGRITSVDFIFRAELNSSYFDILESFNNKMPAKLSIGSDIAYNSTTGQPEIQATWIYFGTEREARAAMASVFSLDYSVAIVNEISWDQIFTVPSFGVDALFCQPNSIHDMYSINLRNLSGSTFKSTFTKMARFYNENPNTRSSIVIFETFPNQAMQAVPNAATAYPWRDATGYVQLMFGWQDGDKDAETASNAFGKELRNDFVSTSGYPNLSVYVNYGHGDESVEQVYGASKLPRLAALKRTWDPENIFRYNFPIPTLYP
ncbi:Glucooligosaccharide oxidase [Nemania abortiva]|nr:Glucooligosaccharide oxidase [Nemania abortiva]